MFRTFTRDARMVLVRAHDEALRLGSPNVEAEHLLLAIAHDDNSPSAVLLREEGLDDEGLTAALERENELSLAIAGVSIADFDLPKTPPKPRRKPRVAASGVRAIKRGSKAAAARGDKKIVAAHLLLGILRADVGTVPRALAAADVDRVALATRTERLLG